MESVLTFLPAGDSVLQEVDGDGVVVWQVALAVECQERVAFALGVVFGCELLCADPNWSRLIHRDLLICSFHRELIFIYQLRFL